LTEEMATSLKEAQCKRWWPVDSSQVDSTRSVPHVKPFITRSIQHRLIRHKYHYTLCFKKTGTLFISFIIHSNDDQFTQNFYQM